MSEQTPTPEVVSPSTDGDRMYAITAYSDEYKGMNITVLSNVKYFDELKIRQVQERIVLLMALQKVKYNRYF